MAQSDQQIKELNRNPDFPSTQLREIAVNASKATSTDVEILTALVACHVGWLESARCVCGAPLVTITYPRLPDSSPFPTLFYLSHPWIVKEVSQIESVGEMATMNAELAADETLAAAHKSAHKLYFSAESACRSAEIADFSAGGMPDRGEMSSCLGRIRAICRCWCHSFWRPCARANWLAARYCRCELEAK